MTSKSSSWRQKISKKICPDIKFVMKSKTCVMTSKTSESLAWCQKVRHAVKRYQDVVKKCVMTSNKTSWHQQVHPDVIKHEEKCVMMSKSENVCHEIIECVMTSKTRHDVTKFAMTLNVRHVVKKFVMTSKSSLWRQRHVKKCVMTSKSSSLRQKVRHDVKKHTITSKTRHSITSSSWCQKVRHDVKNTSWRQKNSCKIFRHDVKKFMSNISSCQKGCSSWHEIVRHDVKKVHHVKKCVMASKARHGVK